MSTLEARPPEYYRQERMKAVAPEMYELMHNTASYILECARIYKTFPQELVTYATRIREFLARIDGEENIQGE